MRFSTLKHLSLVAALLCGTAHTYAQQVFYESFDGRRVNASHLQPGIYVSNGKKVVVR